VPEERDVMSTVSMGSGVRERTGANVGRRLRRDARCRILPECSGSCETLGPKEGGLDSLSASYVMKFTIPAVSRPKSPRKSP